MASIGWLHLTDLHQGLPGQQWLWPAVKDAFFEDLKILHEKSGPWDLVFFTGDLTQRGSEAEFELLGETLDKLWAHLKALGSAPAFVPVPGNHDLVRPGKSGKRHPLERALDDWHADAELRSEFWSTDDNDYRALVREVFAPYESFRASRPLPAGFTVKTGVLPGDLSVSFTHDNLSVALVGLNTSFLQLTGVDYANRLELDPRQFHAVTDPSDPTGWVRSHDVALLLTHHPTSWLHPETRARFVENIAPPGLFLAHLFGHMHESTSTVASVGGAPMQRAVQGPSLFGLETYGDGTTERSHGYMAARVDITDKNGTFKLWPRASMKARAGHRQMVPDYGCTLVTEATTDSFQARRSVAPPPVKLPPGGGTAKPDSGRPSVAMQRPDAGYDEDWYAPRPDFEHSLRECLDVPRSPAVIRSSRGMGKTWMLEHVTRSLGDGARVVWERFDLLDGSSEEAFLRSLADSIAEKCGMPESVAVAWAVKVPATVRMRGLMQKWLSADERPLVLVLDVPDAWLESPVWARFASMLRSWNDAGSDPPFDRLRLLVSWSTLPTAWQHDAGSPFRVPDLELDDLDDAAIAWLAERHNVPSDADTVALARSLVGGHPSLLRRLFYAMYRGQSIADIEARWRVDGGVFATTDLRGLIELLREEGSLREAFARVTRGEGSTVDGETLDRLIAAGLVLRTESGAKIRYRVYEILPRLL